MPEPDPARIMTFASPKDLGRWLKVNHATESELWVKIFKKGTGIPSVTWDDVVIETLCWGWIDGVKKSLDTPRGMGPRRARRAAGQEPPRRGPDEGARARACSFRQSGWPVGERLCGK